MEPLGSRSSAHRIVLQALGVPARAPTLLLTDNLANQKVSQNAQSATRSRYFLIRSACLHQRIADGEVCVVHVPDPENPSDYLTKFIGAEKTASSIATLLDRQAAAFCKGGCRRGRRGARGARGAVRRGDGWLRVSPARRLTARRACRSGG